MKRYWPLLIGLGLAVGCSRGPAVPEVDEDFQPLAEAPLTVSEEEPAPPSSTQTADPAALTFDGEQAMQYLEGQMAFGPRITGTPESIAAGDYILEEVRRYGWQTETQEFLYRATPVRNLIAKKEGEGGGEGYIVLGAHYDTRRAADEDPLNPEVPVPGANDGGSGTAVLMELARVLDVSKVNHDVWLVFFDAEDNGRLYDWEWIVGSTYFADQMEIFPEYVIVPDLIGDADQNVYYEVNSDPLLSRQLWATAEQLGYSDTIIQEEKYSMLDDHTPFLVKGIPAVVMIDFDYEYWHTVEDTIDKVSADSLERVGRTLEVFLESGGEREDASAPTPSE